MKLSTKNPGGVYCAEFILGWPPTSNHFWGACGNNRYLKPEYKQFLTESALIIAGTRLKVAPGYFVEITATPPDNRVRDLDNVIKPILDALTRCGVWSDDKLVVKLNAEKTEPEKNAGRVRVLCGVAGALKIPENKNYDPRIREFFAIFSDALEQPTTHEEFSAKIRSIAFSFRELIEGSKL